MGRGQLPSSAPLLAYLHCTSTQILVQDWTLMSRAENHTSRNCLKGPQLTVGLVKLSRQNVLTSLHALTV